VQKIRPDSASLPDEEEAAEFCAWIDPHWSVMRRIAFRLGGSSGGEDVLQNALLAAWRHRGRYDPSRGSAAAWLTTLTVNEGRKAHRRRRRASALLDVSNDADPLARIDLQRAIAALPERQALAVNLFYYADLPLRETATAMGCAEGTVKSTLAAARAALRLSLQEDAV
jgi:RNA polymerase sigma-70 factor (ECF subfamily)